MANLVGKFLKSKKQKLSLRFGTHHPCAETLDGYVVDIQKSHIVLCTQDDFRLDGITILPIKRIIKCRDGKFEACINKILRMNGVQKKAKVPKWLARCETIQEVLRALMKRDIWPGVEILFNKGKRSAYYLGPITDVGADQFSIRCYDAAGRWEKTYQLGIIEIFKLNFGDHYSKVFNKFMRAV